MVCFLERPLRLADLLGLAVCHRGQAGLAEKAAGIPGAASAPVILSDEGLSAHLRERTVKDFGKKRCLLKDISLNIPPNSLVLLLGGSGAGKTTLINALIGYEQADATVLLNGVNVYKEYDRVKHKIGFVPQQNLIRGKDTVIRTVSDAAKMRLPTSISTEQRKQLIKEDMDLLGLSAGRLDGVISREIFTKLRRIADDGRIVIVITHTPDRVIDLFDKVIVLARDSGRVGRLAFYGSPQEAREFFGKDSMEKIVMSVNSKDEGGEGRADEFIAKYAAYAAQRDSAAGAAIEKDTADAASGKGGQES